MLVLNGMDSCGHLPSALILEQNFNVFILQKLVNEHVQSAMKQDAKEDPSRAKKN